MEIETQINPPIETPVIDIVNNSIPVEEQDQTQVTNNVDEAIPNNRGDEGVQEGIVISENYEDDLTHHEEADDSEDVNLTLSTTIFSLNSYIFFP